MQETSTRTRRVPTWAQSLIWIILAGLLLLVGLGLRRSQEGTVQPGDRIPDFTLTFFSGYEYNGLPKISNSELRGKVVLINFWASWCKPCEQEAPFLEQAWRHYENDGRVVFLGVDYVDTEPQARVFLKKFGNTYPNGPDTGTAISQLFRIKGVPETYFIDQNGVLQYVKVGPFTSVNEIHSILDGIIK